jgi:regulator of sigma E protease
LTFVIGIVALGFLVFFHESGHFAAARIFGVKVEAFSVGMGPVLLHKKIGGTDYRISLVPLGGYCSMKGEKDFQKAIEENSAEISGDADSFYGVHALKRLLIAFAGPFANFVFSVAAFTVVALTGYTYFSAGTKVSMADEIYPEISSSAHRSGMESGDEILSINGEETGDFSEIIEKISVRPGETVKICARRGDEILFFDVEVVLDREYGSGKIGVVSDSSSVVERVCPGKKFFPSLKEGFAQSFKIIALTGKSISILFRGVKITNAVSGPVRITGMLGATVKDGFSLGIKTGIASTLQFMALISISLFLTNLLPVPILDGGLILFALVEFFSRRKMNPKVLYYIQIAGVIVVSLIFVLAMTSDFLYFLHK